MSRKRSVLAAAFNARPLGMPVPPNWFFLAAVGLLGTFVDPGFFLIGAGLEGLYLWALSRSERFRKTVQADDAGAAVWEERYRSLAESLDRDSLQLQGTIEALASETVELLARSGAHESQIGDVRRMAWLHLKLLAARSSLGQVTAAAQRERRSLEDQEERLEARLREDDGDDGDELRRSLEQQIEVIRSRRAAHADAERRRELVEAELERLRQQVALVREQALLATDEQSVASSLDALSASLNEATRLLKDQRELFAGLDALADDQPPADLLRPKAPTGRRRERISE
jgi:hypothetical protein